MDITITILYSGKKKTQQKYFFFSNYCIKNANYIIHVKEGSY